MIRSRDQRDAPHRISTGRYRAAIFDLDGVITDTASLHFEAWKEVFDALLRERNDRPFRPFTERDYRDYVDGKPRYDGIESFLASRDLDLPRGEERDPPSLESVRGLGALKNRRYLERLANREVPTYRESLDFVDELRHRGMRTAVVSSSKNCKRVLSEAGLEERFEARVDGVDLEEHSELAGKPAPDMFVEAARRLDVAPSEAIVIEDAEAGVEAGRAGEFGLVIGVARSDEAREDLARHGADLVVSSLSSLEIVDGFDADDRRDGQPNARKG